MQANQTAHQLFAYKRRKTIISTNHSCYSQFSIHRIKMSLKVLTISIAFILIACCIASSAQAREVFSKRKSFFFKLSTQFLIIFFFHQFNLVWHRVHLPTAFEIAMQMDIKVAIAIQMTTAFAMHWTTSIKSIDFQTIECWQPNSIRHTEIIFYSIEMFHHQHHNAFETRIKIVYYFFVKVHSERFLCKLAKFLVNSTVCPFSKILISPMSLSAGAAIFLLRFRTKLMQFKCK